MSAPQLVQTATVIVSARRIAAWRQKVGNRRPLGQNGGSSPAARAGARTWWGIWTCWWPPTPPSWPGGTSRAYGNGTFLASWQSGRVATGDLCSSSPNFIGSIVAARLDKAGKVLDQQPFVISDAADLQERPSVAYGGGVFVVVWQDLRNGKDWDVYAARVSSDGKVLDKSLN